MDERGARQRTVPFEDFYEITGTALGKYPLTDQKPNSLAQRLDDLSRQLQDSLPGSLTSLSTLAGDKWHKSKQKTANLLNKMIALQEELDWECYQLYGLLNENGDKVIWQHGKDSLPPIQLGERAFEIVLARKMAAGEVTTTWFARHDSTPITELPAHWPDDYRQLVERRIAAIATNANIRLIEQPEYKRRWNSEPWEAQAERALREWLLNRLEDPRYWSQPALTSVARLADQVRNDHEWMQVAEMYRGRADFEVLPLVTELVKAEAVPFLPIFRYKQSGLEKRRVWERTWELQRQEDAIDARTTLDKEHPQYLTAEAAKRRKAEQIGDIPVPPKYKSTDFRDGNYWRLRGKLDVPKERFISYPKCEREVDTTLVIGWAGWNHLEQAQALAEYYTRAKEQEGWSPARLVPLLTGLVELLPWLKQWHNDMDAQYGMGLGDFFQEFVEEEARSLGLTINNIREWEPID